MFVVKYKNKVKVMKQESLIAFLSKTLNWKGRLFEEVMADALDGDSFKMKTTRTEIAVNRMAK